MKDTETFVLRYLLSTEHGDSMPVSSTSYNYSTGVHETLLSTGVVIKRPKTEGEIVMPVYLTESVRLKVKVDGRMQDKRFLQQSFELAKDRKNETVQQKNARLKVEFFKEHNAVKYLDSKGVQLNPNFPETAKAYYELINLDEKEGGMAELEIKYNDLVAELISIKEIPEDLSNMAYAVGIDPQNLSPDAVFNLIKKVIQKDPFSFEKKIRNDSDKYHKIVVNKALRVKNPDSGSNYLIQTEQGMYSMNGQIIASSYDALILYYKENPEMFAFLENELGFKKKEPITTSSKSAKAK
jgi:hypothetical protein